MTRNLLGSGLLAVAALACAWSALTWLTGGFAIRAGLLHIASHDAVRPLLVAAACSVAARLLLPAEDFASWVRRAVGNADTVCARAAVAGSIAILIVSVAWNTRAAGGSDSSSYLLQADAFTAGEIMLRDPLAASAPFANAGALFAPIGFISSPVERAAAAPVCAPGLALLMAGASIAAGRGAAMAVVPVCAAITIWLTFVYGRKIDGPLTGAVAALLVACSPIFLYQAVQPMSDVPATALWLAALVACAHGRTWSDSIGGLCAGLAILTRENIALIVAPLVVLLIAREDSFFEGFLRSNSRTRSLAATMAPLLRFGVALIPALAVLAWLNTARYGSPLASGYGGMGALFRASHVWPNLRRYPVWMIETHTPFILLAIFAPWVARRPGRERLVLVVTSLVCALLLLATYLVYVVFDDWWYLRFLLPGLPVLLVLSVTVTLSVARQTAPGRVHIAAICACVALGGWYLHVARARQVFALQSLESRFVQTGRYARLALPSNAVVLSVQESGAIRYHGARLTMTWDVVSDVDAAVRWLASANRPVYLALEDAEEAAFRRRFAGQALGALDWPPMSEIHARVRVRIYDVRDRAKYLNGERLSVTHVR